jgi:site-specific recombinase XerD
MKKQVLANFGSVSLNRITNAMARQWVSTLLSSGLSAASTRKAVFALRQCLAAAIADERIQFNPAAAVPLPTERQKPPRYLSQSEVERLQPTRVSACRDLGTSPHLVQPVCAPLRAVSHALLLAGWAIRARRLRTA